MGFNLLWTQEHIEAVSKDFSDQIGRDLEKALKDKQRQLKCVSNMANLSSRFQDIISLDNLTVAEIRFSSMSAEYRALCIVIPDQKLVVYYDLVPKKGSYQERRLKLIRENANAIEESIRKSIDQENL